METSDQRVATQYKNPKNLEARISLHAKYGTATQPWNEWLFAKMALPSGAVVLELGCGSAYFWRENLKNIDPTWRVYLTDLSEGMLAKAKEGVGGSPEVFQFATMNAENLDFPNEHFDAVIANHMLYHVSDRPRALREILRVLKPQGVLYAATNGERNMEQFRKPEVFQILHPNGPPEGILFQSEGAKNWFTLERGAEELAAVFGRVGVEKYADQLRVSDVDALIAYHESYLDLNDKQKVELGDYYESEKRLDGCVPITKSVGLLVAKK